MLQVPIDRFRRRSLQPRLVALVQRLQLELEEQHAAIWPYARSASWSWSTMVMAVWIYDGHVIACNRRNAAVDGHIAPRTAPCAAAPLSRRRGDATLDGHRS
jgi:hypothetical protein